MESPFSPPTWGLQGSGLVGNLFPDERVQQLQVAGFWGLLSGIVGFLICCLTSTLGEARR